MEQIKNTSQYSILLDLLNQLKCNPNLGIHGLMKCWSQVPHEAFSDEEGRELIHEIQDYADRYQPALFGHSDYTDVYLSEARLNHILWEISQGKDSAYGCLYSDLCWLEDYSFSDTFCHRLITLLMFLIQFKHYDYVVDLLKIVPWAGRFEDIVNKSRNCVYTYAIEMIPDDKNLLPLLETIDAAIDGDLFMERKTPAMAAVELKRYNILKCLFDRNMCSEKYAVGSLTVMQYAVSTENLELLHYALSELHHPADSIGFTTQTPLMLAVEKDSLEFATVLLQHGANPNATDDKGMSILSYCKSSAMHDLLDRYHAIARDIAAEVLSEAIRVAKNGPVPKDLIDEVIKHSPNTITYQDSNLALISADNGYVENLQHLLSHYDLSELAEELACAVFHAAVPQFKSVSLLIQLTDILINAGIKVQMDSIKMFHPFTELSDRPEIFDPVSLDEAYELFDKVNELGFDPLATMYTGTNLLHFAIQGMNIPLIRYCLDQGLSLMDLEESKGVAEILLTHLPISKKLCLNDENREVEVWKFCEAYGCDINHRNDRGETALHAIVRASWVSTSMIEIALSLGVDPFIQNKDGRTAAQLASDRGCRSDIIEFLKTRCIT